MQILKARFRGRDDFMEAYQADRPNGALFVATTTPLDTSEDVIVELVCDGLPNKVLIGITPPTTTSTTAAKAPPKPTTTTTHPHA